MCTSYVQKSGVGSPRTSTHWHTAESNTNMGRRCLRWIPTELRICSFACAANICYANCRMFLKVGQAKQLLFRKANAKKNATKVVKTAASRPSCQGVAQGRILMMVADPRNTSK